MVRLTRIYTRSGDEGTTALGNGDRCPKYDLRIAAFGTTDETNAAIGIARLFTQEAYPLLDALLARIQNELFDLGADLCVPETDSGFSDKPPLRILPSQVKRLEEDIDTLNKETGPVESFVLPGGTPASAHLHIARTICRRAERLMVELATQPYEHVSKPALHYINRLSDFLFAAARYANDKGKSDVLWVPGGTREETQSL